MRIVLVLSFFLCSWLAGFAGESCMADGSLERADTLVADSVVTGSVAMEAEPDTAAVRKKGNWLVRAYRFCDRVLSPERDSNYIDVQNYNWCAELQLTSRFEIYEIDAENSFHLKLSPHWRTRLGPFFGWRWAFLGYNFDLKSIFINSEDTDLGGSVYSAAFGLDLFYRRVGGNYNIREFSYGGNDYSDILMDRTVNGIRIGMTRVSFYYILNYKRYSHQAAFSQTNRQLRSAGSPILGFSYAHNSVALDWDKLNASVVSGADVATLPNMFQKIKNDEYSLTGGYAYNWVFAKNWLAAGEMTGSLGYLIHHSDVKDEQHSSIIGQIDSFYRKNIAFNSSLRLALLWNNGPWFAGTQSILFYYRYGNGSVTTRNLMGSVYLYVGCNF